jgi:7-keto-8-aminopelargonate synthetase-like enzyme
VVRNANGVYGFLLRDESHAIGVLGPDGGVTCQHAGVQPAMVDVITGSLGKAFPSCGGFVAGARGLINYLQHGSAPYMFSSATTPANTAAIRETVRVIRSEPEHLEGMWKNTARLHGIIDDLDLPRGNTETPIVPVILGDTLRTYAWARHLLDDGIYVSVVPHPAVPEGSPVCGCVPPRPAVPQIWTGWRWLCGELPLCRLTRRTAGRSVDDRHVHIQGLVQAVRRRCLRMD